jgi:NADP-dependent 3-hydroxy acid dehydrogenase YdfG
MLTSKVLVNNAGIAKYVDQDRKNLRSVYAEVYDTNVTSVARICEVFGPIISETSKDGRIINVSSRRGSIGLTAAGEMPSESYKSMFLVPI